AAGQGLTGLMKHWDNPACGGVPLPDHGLGRPAAIGALPKLHGGGRVLEKRGLKIVRSLVGSYVTSLEMAGCSITVTQLDDKLTGLWDDRIHTAALRW